MGERVGQSAFIALIAGAAGYWFLKAIISASCSSFYPYENEINAANSATLGAAAIALTSFCFAFAVVSRSRIERFEKLAVLALLMMVLIWLAYVALDGMVCSPRAWRTYFAFLLVPSFAMIILLVGRSWLNTDD